VIWLDRGGAFVSYLVADRSAGLVLSGVAVCNPLSEWMLRGGYIYIYRPRAIRLMNRLC
jgi:hypothetical protein